MGSLPAAREDGSGACGAATGTVGMLRFGPMVGVVAPTGARGVVVASRRSMDGTETGVGVGVWVWA